MKKYLSLLLLMVMFVTGLFAQDAGGSGGAAGGTGGQAGVGAGTGAGGAGGGSGSGAAGGAGGQIDIVATLKEIEDLKKTLADQKKELDEQKTAAELAKLSEADRTKKQLELDKQALESERQKLNLDKNTVLGKSILLSEKINIGGEFLPYLNVTATDTEAEITTRATNLKSALDAYVKRFIDDKTAGFDPAKKGGTGGGGSDDVTAYAAKLAGNSGAVKGHSYFKIN